MSAWNWRYERADATEVLDVSVPAGDFANQSDAETWLGEVWRDLLGQGVDRVLLYEGDRLVYGPMSLHAP
jgi:hypothetical protein